MDDDAGGPVEGGPATSGAGGSGGSVASRWTAVRSGDPVHLKLSCQQRGYCYLLHLNEKDELKVIFPSKLDLDNQILGMAGELYVPSRFSEGGKKRYLKFDTKQGMERETFYLLTTSHRLDSFESVGKLPDNWSKLPPATSHAILASVREHVNSASVTRDVDTLPMMDVSDSGSTSTGDVVMALSTLTLISVAEHADLP
jgi:hypothetical protein